MSTQASTKASPFTWLDASRFAPFRAFRKYYIPYSTWLGAVWPLGVVFLLVVYGGSYFVSWVRVRNIEQLNFGPLPSLNFTSPDVSIYFPDADGITPLCDAAFYTVSFFQCMKTTSAPSPVCSQISSTCSATGGHQPDTSGVLFGGPSNDEIWFMTASVETCSPCSATAQAFFDANPDLVYLSNNVVELPDAADREDLLDSLPDLLHETAFRFSLDHRAKFAPIIHHQGQIVDLEPSYFGASITAAFSEARIADVFYETSDAPTVAEFTMQLEDTVRKRIFVPTTLLLVIARFGQLFAALAIGNWFIHRVNFLTFFAVADETYYVPDIATRKTIMANRSVRVRDFENYLMFALTFGHIRRYGVQTRHVWEFFNRKEQRFDRKSTQAIVEDISKYMMHKRIGDFVHEERKTTREVEADYDIQSVDPGSLINILQHALKGQVAFQEDDDDLGDDGIVANSNKKVIHEVETTLKLCVLQDELMKMRTVAAMLWPPIAKRERLGENLMNYGKKNA